jgi:hypothetical protein
MKQFVSRLKWSGGVIIEVVAAHGKGKSGTELEGTKFISEGSMWSFINPQMMHATAE